MLSAGQDRPAVRPRVCTRVELLPALLLGALVAEGTYAQELQANWWRPSSWFHTVCTFVRVLIEPSQGFLNMLIFVLAKGHNEVACDQQNSTRCGLQGDDQKAMLKGVNFGYAVPPDSDSAAWRAVCIGAS